ncbi:MAG: TlpA disulfide reductase family protein, partial [Bowdeniella nasicola]|nr:TlpA disulfide reductase family protein [Bowdeniella nasicola]
SSAWRGSVAVINFWYSACPPCRAEATDLQALHEEFPEVYFLGVNPRDEVSAANAFVDTFAITYPNVLDTNATIVADLQGKVPLQAMPTTIVIDPQGRIYGRILGRITPSVLRGMIEDARAEAGDG